MLIGIFSVKFERMKFQIAMNHGLIGSCERDFGKFNFWTTFSGYMKCVESLTRLFVIKARCVHDRVFTVLWLHFVNEFFEHLNIQLIQCTHFIFEKTFFICSQEKYKVDHIKVNNDAIDQTVL